MAGLEIKCPSCGSGEFELVEAGRHQCVFCRTLYDPPVRQGSGSFSAGPMPEKAPDPLRPDPVAPKGVRHRNFAKPDPSGPRPAQGPHVVYVQQVHPKATPLGKVVLALAFALIAAVFIHILVSWFNASKEFSEADKKMEEDSKRRKKEWERDKKEFDERWPGGK